jgi:hypothetical protein
VTLYLLDANVLITADAQYYEMSRVPEFWDWLKYQGEQGTAKLPVEVFEEVVAGSGDLTAWLKEPDNKAALLLLEEADQTRVNAVISQGYAPDLNDSELEALGRDPFLISYALVAPADRCVVTTEVSKPSAKRHNRKIPDVCQTVGASCVNSFEFVRRLDFRTNWNR